MLERSHNKYVVRKRTNSLLSTHTPTRQIDRTTAYHCIPGGMDMLIRGALF